MLAEPDINTGQILLLTPPGSAAIALVRLIGPGVRPFLARNFSREATEGKPIHGTLADGERIIDDPVVVLLPDGAGADISLHGGPWVVRSMIELARRDGFSVVESRGASATDFMVEGRTLIEREVLASLGSARTQLALRILLGQAEAWDRLLKNPPARAEIERILTDRSLHFLLNPPTVAIVGAPNVGKSTLANQLFGQERSITADLPGTTRDWVGELANVDGLPVMLVDTPGQRATHDPIEQSAIEQSRAPIGSADLILLLLDATRPLDPEQTPLIDAYPTALRVANKCDQPAVWNVPAVAAIQTAATSGAGVDTLRAAIVQYFGCGNLDPGQARCWTDRHVQLLHEIKISVISNIR